MTNITQNAAGNSSQSGNGTINNGNTIITSLPGQIAFNTQGFIFWLNQGGPNLDIRMVYVVSHEGFGGSGFANLLTTVRNFNNTAGAYTFNSLTLDSSGQVILNATITSGTFDYLYRITPIGFRYGVLQ